LIFAAKTMAGCVLDMMTKPEILVMAKEEHKRRLGGNIYKPDVDRKPPLEVARESAAKLKGKI
jgi:hypothetical protein